MREYPYTAPSVDLIGNGTVTTFTYGDDSNPDRLSSYRNNSINYDDIGHPYSYGNKYLTWSFDNKLLKYFDLADESGAFSSESTDFEYNGLGQRIRKEYVYNPGNDYSGNFLVGTTSTYDYDHSGRLIREISTDYFTESASETRELVFLYDESGMVGFTYSLNGATPTSYYYQRNLLGDVIGIYNTSGTKVVEYAYDAWGNCTIVYSSNDTLANDNPIRYRGYYFDIENNFYYLNARYYSPEFRRFISPDDTSYLDYESVNGLNLYCYCNNDPVNFVDPSGHMPKWLKWLIGGAAFVGAVVLTAVTGGALTPVVVGMATSIVAGGIIEGSISAYNGDGFWNGFSDGAANGAMWGGIFSMIGSSIGAIKYVTSAKGAVKGTQHFTTITKGQMFDRYGRLTGKYITDWGTPITKLALPSTNTGVKTTLMATRNFRVITGTIADAFGNTGGGIQYFMRYSIKTLIKIGWLVVIES